MSTQIPTNGAPATPKDALPSARLARICRALGHPARLRIVEFLMAENRCFCGQIVGRLPLAQSTVSQHLKYLKEAGIVVGLKKGAGTCYCLDKALLRQFQTDLAQFFDER